MNKSKEKEQRERDLDKKEKAASSENMSFLKTHERNNHSGLQGKLDGSGNMYF